MKPFNDHRCKRASPRVSVVAQAPAAPLERHMPALSGPLVLSLMLIAALSVSSCAHKRPAASFTPKIGTREKGIASWYGDPYHGRATASGEIFDMHRRDTAAHQRFAFGTWVRVENLDNGQRTEVRINDRGPFVRGRIIDLARGAANDIGMLGPGTARVRLTVIRHPPSSPPPAPASSGGGGGWAIQVAAFRDETQARALAARIAQAIVVDPSRAAPGSEPWWRVIIPGQSEDAARRLLPSIRREFPEAFLTPRLLPSQ